MPPIRNKRKVFYPWVDHEDWLSRNKDKIKVVGVIQSRYKNTEQNQTTVYYKEKK